MLLELEISVYVFLVISASNYSIKEGYRKKVGDLKSESVSQQGSIKSYYKYSFANVILYMVPT